MDDIEGHVVDPRPWLQAGYIKIIKNTLTGEYRYILMGDNHEPLLHSEYFGKRDDMMDTIDKYFPDWTIADASRDS